MLETPPPASDTSSSAKPKPRPKADVNAKRRKLAVESDEDGQGGDNYDGSGHTNAGVKQKRLNLGDGDSDGGVPAKQRSVEEDETAEEGEQLYDEDDAADNDSTIAGGTTGSTSGGAGNGGEKDGSKNFSDLIVLGLPFKLTEQELREYFEQFGTVALSEIKKKDSGNSKGFGFVRMDSMEGQIRVLNKPVHTIGNRKCQVKVPLSKVSRNSIGISE